MSNEYDHFLWFDPHIASTSRAIDDVVNHLKAEVLAIGKIKRWHKKFGDHIRLIVLNLYNTAFIDRTRYIAYSRNKTTYTKLRKSRYLAFNLSYDSTVNCVDELMNLGYIEGVDGFYFPLINYSRSAKMRATDKLIELCLQYAVNPFQFSQNPAEEVIILKTKDSATRKKYQIDYADTADTVLMRNNLHIINREIENHFIGLNVCDDTLADINKAILGLETSDCAAYDDFEDYEDDADAEEGDVNWKSGNEKYRPYLDMSKIKLKRIFNNGSFEQGGRFYGVWWQAIPSRYRPYIAIDDQQTIEVDYSGIHINLLYMQEGLPLPIDDVYTIKSLPLGAKKVLKVALQILLNSKNEAKALGSIKRKFPVKDHPELFKNHTHEQIIEAFKEKHKGIINHFYKGVGVKLQFIDSQIAEDILLDLSGKGIVVLPVHDSFIVRKDYVKLLKNTMEDVVRKRFGQVLKFKVDKTAYETDRKILAWELLEEDLPISSEEYEREWVSKKREDYLSRRDLWYSERNL